jgi:dUTPase
VSRSSTAKLEIYIQVGVIDNDYSGTIKLSLKNCNSFNMQINRGDFLAQLLISPVIHPELVPLSKIEINTERGTGCFGSSDGQLNNIHSAESPSIFLNQLEQVSSTK